MISETQDKVKQVFTKKAKEAKSEIYFADELYVHRKESYIPKFDFTAHKYKVKGIKEELVVLVDLLGTYQKYNLAGVLTAINLLKKILR